MTERLIFSQTFEGLRAAVGARLQPATRVTLCSLGVDFERPFLPAYPHATFLGVLDCLSSDLYPALGKEAGVAAVARAFMDGYGSTLVGRAMVTVMRMLGPRRTLERLTRQFRTANNFSETRLRALGDRDFELWCSHVASPGWYFGIIGRGLELAGARDVKVVMVEHATPDGATFRIRWT